MIISLDLKRYSPHKYQKKPMLNRVENIHADAWSKKVKQSL